MRRLLLLTLISIANASPQSVSAQAATPPEAAPAPAAAPAPVTDPNAAQPPAPPPTAQPTYEAPAGSEQLDPRFSESSMDNNLAVLGLFSFGYAYSGFGAGARYQKTILPLGFLNGNAPVHDDFGIEGSFDFIHSSYDYGYLTNNYDISVNVFEIGVSAIWNFWLNPQIAVYPRLGLLYSFSSVSSPSSLGSYNAGYSGVYFAGGAGLVYKLSALTLRAELGWRAIGLGVGFTP